LRFGFWSKIYQSRIGGKEQGKEDEDFIHHGGLTLRNKKDKDVDDRDSMVSLIARLECCL
jgi:hypothetical protein